MGKKGPKWTKNEVFCLFLDKESLEFANIAYGNRERWYLAGGSGLSAEKKRFGSVWAIIGSRAPAEVEPVAQFAS